MPGLRRLDDGFEITVAGGPDRDALADEVERARDELVSASLRLMGLYLAPGFAPGGFHAGFAEVFARPTPDRGDLAMSFTFTPADDPHGEADTRFDVFFTVGEPPRPRFHPFRFAVGFW